MTNWYIKNGKVLTNNGKIRGCCCDDPVEYRIRTVDRIRYRGTYEEDLDGMTAAEQHIRVGQILGALYPPHTYYENTYTNDSVAASHYEAPGDPEPFWAYSSGIIYEIYNPITNQPLVGQADVSGIRYNLSLTKSPTLDNPTTGFMGIGSSSSLPSGVPCNWNYSVFSSSVPVSGGLVPTFTSSRYFWLMKKLTNAGDAWDSTPGGWTTLGRNVSASLNLYYATAFK